MTWLRKKTIENSKDVVIEDGVDSDCIASEIDMCVVDLDRMIKMKKSQEESFDLANIWAAYSACMFFQVL